MGAQVQPIKVTGCQNDGLLVVRVQLIIEDERTSSVRNPG